jgi:hypothetical protein
LFDDLQVHPFRVAFAHFQKAPLSKIALSGTMLAQVSGGTRIVRIFTDALQYYKLAEGEGLLSNTRMTALHGSDH